MSNKKVIIENGDVVFATGVHLRRDTTVNGGWVIDNFLDDTYFNGLIVNTEIDGEKVVYFTGDDEDDEEL